MSARRTPAEWDAYRAGLAAGRAQDDPVTAEQVALALALVKHYVAALHDIHNRLEAGQPAPRVQNVAIRALREGNQIVSSSAVLNPKGSS